MGQNPYVTRANLQRDLEALGLRRGDAVMVHAAISKVGPMLAGPDTVIGALRDVVGSDGTILAYADWNVVYDHLLDEGGRVQEAWREEIPAFDPASAHASRDHGVFPEFLRATPGALRSGNPGASMIAVGARAQAFTENHPMQYGYGEDSPFGRLVAADGKVLMLGAPLDTMTLLHHAEHLADIPGKRVQRYEAPLLQDGQKRWVLIEEFDTGDPVIDGLNADFFADIVNGYLESGRGKRGQVGRADSVLVDAAGIVAYAVDWLEQFAANRSR
ncbi:aminoglycoside 3-N-acetyltransferase [Bauldia sp.]|uniref:aminoglycoside 3-N-acetyltransferase n=1 Tax=Bauldia sp. TaxID=2575872 RepID=UPI003BAC870C